MRKQEEYEKTFTTKSEQFFDVFMVTSIVLLASGLFLGLLRAVFGLIDFVS